MFDNLKQSWQTLRHAPAGERFQQYHARSREGRGHGLMRLFKLLLGVALVLVGLVMMPAPGPGMVVVVVGACVMAGQSRRTARWLDGSELRVRALLRRWRR
ncbi:MAG TPA: PGPGW domain-containing protein [Solimonas sp.]|nr:PGPGW domain-containing protein [Solimonas sp.]